MSKIEVMEVDTTEYKYLTYSINSTNYSIARLTIGDYIEEKKTTTMTCGDKDKVIIKIKLTPINKEKALTFTIEDSCDDIILGPDFYSTIFYGCCGGQDVITYYDYKSNHKICQGQPGIISYQTPNHDFRCYVGYTVAGFWPGEVCRNTLNIAYSTGETFKVSIIDTILEECMVSKLTFVTNNPNDIISDSYLTHAIDIPMDYSSSSSLLWSLNGIESINKVSDLKIVLSLYFSSSGKKVIEIPIINGKPFGKNNPEQVINIKDM